MGQPDDTAALETEAAEEARAQADFESGMPAEPEPTKPGAKSDNAAKPAPKPAAAAPPPPEYVRLTRIQFDALNASAARTAGFEAQLSKAFGAIGGVQKVLSDLRSGSNARRFEIPKDAFAGMERDFPELAEHTRAALEATLRGATGFAGGADIDPEQMTRLITEHAAKARTEAEIESLEDEYPTWRAIVGQVDISKQQPDKNNPFRKWLATKDSPYQLKLNSTNSAAVISRAIRTFQAETKATGAAAPSLRAQLQAARIKGAVQPRGDGGHVEPSLSSAQDQFEAGFASR
jgi:hypothetical protein